MNSIVDKSRPNAQKSVNNCWNVWNIVFSMNKSMKKFCQIANQKKAQMCYADEYSQKRMYHDDHFFLFILTFQMSFAFLVTNTWGWHTIQLFTNKSWSEFKKKVTECRLQSIYCVCGYEYKLKKSIVYEQNFKVFRPPLWIESALQ